MDIYQLMFPEYYDKYLIDFKYIYHSDILDSFITLITAHNISIKSISIIKETIKERYELHKKCFSLDEDDYHDFMSIDHAVVSALFINLYGIIELESIRLCKQFVHLKKTIEDMRQDKGIDRIATLIKETKSINIKSSLLYRQMVEMRDVRNCLAHANGHIPDYNDKKKIVEIAKNHDFLRVCDDNLLIYPSGFDKLLEYGFNYNYYCVNELLNTDQ